MPKSTPPLSTVAQARISSANPLLAMAPATNVLKRNQACHQCRRRKLKCDAKRPCSTCIRSHAHQRAHAPPGVEIPPAPICTFDEVPDTPLAAQEGPKNKYERLENRITELESLLRQKDGNGGFFTQYYAHREIRPSDLLSSSHLPVSGSNGRLNGRDSDAGSSGSYSRSPALYNDTTGVSIPESHSPTSPGLDLIWPHWPTGLPSPELLRHLVDVFFTFHPHANRLFHASTFLNSVALPPTHPKFPSTPLLHAICAIGSLYTAAVTSPPLPDLNEMAPDEIFVEKHRVREQRPDSFAEQQAKLARETSERMNALGQNLLQVLQTNIILTWFYWSHGRWVDVFLTSALSTRLCVPLGLNMCPPFHSISTSVRPVSILPPARNVIEDETRRNAFWLAYAAERLHGSGNGWSLSLDDEDVSQLMPLRGDFFDQGTLVAATERQWVHSPDLLLRQPEEQTDSFTLYIKGTVLLSKVKSFNSRFRAKHYAKDPAVLNPYAEAQPSGRIDPRGSVAFIELDHTAASFRESFRSREPIVDNVVDNQLFTTCLMPHLATIILHDPHAEVEHSGCLSALKILTAARAILDLIYSISTTSYDISLLDTFCTFCWFSAGRVLTRFLRVATEAKSLEQVATLRTEIDFIHSAISKVGQRIPLAYRIARILEDSVVKTCGQALQQKSALWPQEKFMEKHHGSSAFIEDAIFDDPRYSMDTIPDSTAFVS